jgi:hypothetical protein
MHADAKQTEFCTYLSAILLAGLLLNVFFGLWWADPVAALIMVPIIAKEGIEGLQGKACDDCAQKQRKSCGMTDEWFGALGTMLEMIRILRAICASNLLSWTTATRGL